MKPTVLEIVIVADEGAYLLEMVEVENMEMWVPSLLDVYGAKHKCGQAFSHDKARSIIFDHVNRARRERGMVY